MSAPVSHRVRGEVPAAADEPGKLVSVLAVRPQVLPLVVEYQPKLRWGDYIEFEGTQDELLGAGVATPEMFSDFGVHEVRSGPDEFGCKFTLERSAPDRFRLMRFLKEDPSYGDVADRPQNWSQLLREAEPSIRASVAATLKRVGGAGAQP